MKTTLTFTGLELATLRHAMEFEIAQMPREAKKDYASALLEKLGHSSQNRETYTRAEWIDFVGKFQEDEGLITFYEAEQMVLQLIRDGKMERPKPSC